MHSNRFRSRHPTRGERHARARAGVGPAGVDAAARLGAFPLAVGVALVGCTLTQGDFEPTLAEPVALQPEGPGPVLAPPSPALPCIASSDCPSGFECSGQQCVASVCTGGGVAQELAACLEPLCPDGVCSAPSTCEDGQLGAEETGVDCGGPCAPCDLADSCDGDCAGSCVAGQCAAPSCNDGVTNQDETGPDCGGAVCSPCVPQLGCVAASDCQSGVCSAAGCAAATTPCCQSPSCEDGVQNDGETAPDCGSDACGPCEAEVLCADAEQNGDESAVDCGGTEPGCARCLDGQACGTASDCESSRCEAGACSSCSDGFSNGGEGGVDCGSSEPGCPACFRCGVDNSLNLGTAGSVSSLAADACAQITMFPGYAPTLVESFASGTYPVPFSWSQECTGQTGTGVFDAPFDSLTIPGLGLGCPVVFQFDGTSDSFELRWF